jgi:hypothetical protein
VTYLTISQVIAQVIAPQISAPMSSAMTKDQAANEVRNCASCCVRRLRRLSDHGPDFLSPARVKIARTGTHLLSEQDSLCGTVNFEKIWRSIIRTEDLWTSHV